MGKLLTAFLLSTALALIGTVAQAQSPQSPLKQPITVSRTEKARVILLVRSVLPVLGRQLHR
jgi:hypothetical protein